MAKPNVRQQIIDAAQIVFHQKGYNGCGVQDLVQATGVPKGSFYNHFDSKEALGAEIVELYFEQRRRIPILDDASLPAVERLRGYFQVLSDRVIARGFSGGCLVGNFSAELADQSPSVRERLTSIWNRWTADIGAVVQLAQAEGAVASDMDASSLAGFLLNSWEGAVLRAKVDRNRAALDLFMDVVFRKIIS